LAYLPHSASQREQVLFLNYAFEEVPPMGIPLPAKDECNREFIQFNHHVAAQVDLA
jgi:hypothetical protein